MPPSTRSSSKAVETVAARVKRDMRPAAVEACRRIQECSVQEPVVQEPVQQMVGRVCTAAVTQHRYMLRSMRR